MKEIDEIAPYTWADPINEGVIKLSVKSFHLFGEMCVAHSNFECRYLQRNKLTHLVNGTFYNLPNLITL